MPTDQMSPRFTRAVALHLFRNLHPRPDPGSPIMLGIHGPSGEGKTYQCLQVLSGIGVEVVLVSGGLLESPDAGRPAEIIRDAYEKASLIRHKHGVAAAVVINDIDTAVGDWGPLVQTTVNRQIVIEELMNLADTPTQIDGRSVYRSPVILTGNDFTKLYGPLLRFGRMSLFMWRPSLEDKVPIVSNLFPDLAAGDCVRLVNRFSDQPVAFFAQLRQALRDAVIWEHVSGVGLTQSLASMLTGEAPVFRDFPDLDALIAAGHELLSDRHLVNHLEGP
jgi:hypothetical protein